MSSMDDGELIERVSEFPVLFDKKNCDFKNKLKRENAWRTIAVLLNVDSPEECEQRWVVLRNKYTTLKRTIKNTPSGNEAVSITWPYFNAMGFLDPFIQPRRTITNFRTTEPLISQSNSYGGIHTIIQEEEISDSEDRDETPDTPASLPINLNRTAQEPVKLITGLKRPLTEVPRHEENLSVAGPSYIKNVKKLRATIAQPTKKNNEGAGLTQKLDTCLDSFSKMLDKKSQENRESAFDEHFAKSIAKDLQVFTPTEKISVKYEIYKVIERKIREKNNLE